MAQLAAVILALLLAVPPSAAAAVCHMFQPGGDMKMSDCCAGMHHGTCHDMSQVALSAPACTDGCCAAAPQSPAAPSPAIKVAQDAPQVDAVFTALSITPSATVAAVWTAPRGSPAVARHVLLRTFRV